MKNGGRPFSLLKSCAVFRKTLACSEHRLIEITKSTYDGATSLTFGLGWRDEAYATAMLCVVNAHQSLAVYVQCSAMRCGVEEERPLEMEVEGNATNWCFRPHPRLESEGARLQPADALLADSTCLRRSKAR